MSSDGGSAESSTGSEPSSTAEEAASYPDGKMTFWTYGMPEYMKRYFDGYAQREDSGAQGVEIEMVN